MPRSAADPAREWKAREDPTWLEEVFKLDKAVLPDRVRYAGACPDWGHRLTVDVPRPRDLFEEQVNADDDAVSAPDGRCRCNCTEGHAAPKGTTGEPTGCGVYAYAYLP